MYNKKLKITIISLLSTIIAACATQDSNYKPHSSSSYVVRGHNRTFAIYNKEHRLISHPIEELLTEMKWRKLANKPPITDIYVVSHGWNYTLPVAIANYHTYIEMVDNFYNEHKTKIDPACDALQAKVERLREQNSTADQSLDSDTTKCFQPYFIFITWISTVRPFTDAANGILPFGMDAAVRPLTSFIDRVPAHLITAWKQSMNAAQNALGTRYPDYYLTRDWENMGYGYTDPFLFEDADSVMGEDVPVSALLYKLIQMKESAPDSISSKCKKLDIISPDSDQCISLDNTKIHLTGHSYGAKLVALAGTEAIRRWMLIRLSQNSATENKPNMEKLLQKADDSFWKETGHYTTTGSEIFSLWKKEKKPRYLWQLYNSSNQFFPIDSLTLFNPAFLPGELSYPVNFELNAPVDTLRFIPRKAIVYTDSDSANGTLFNIRDTLINTEFSQWMQSLQSNENAKFSQWIKWLKSNEYAKKNHWESELRIFPLETIYHIAQGAAGALELANGVGLGFINFGLNTITDLPMDFWHHIHNYGKPWDFFIPSFKEEKMQGLYRLSRPGLGKTGLNNLAEGRWAEKKLARLAPYYTESQAFAEDELADNSSDKSARDNNNHPFAPNVDAMQFCNFAGKNSFFDTPDYDSAKSDTKLSELREKFFSFDASRVYDSTKWDPIVGAHSDLRKTDLPSRDSCGAVSPKYQKPLQKREYTLNFLLNFTKTNFEHTLNKLK